MVPATAATISHNVVLAVVVAGCVGGSRVDMVGPSSSPIETVVVVSPGSELRVTNLEEVVVKEITVVDSPAGLVVVMAVVADIVVVESTVVELNVVSGGVVEGTSVVVPTSAIGVVAAVIVVVGNSNVPPAKVVCDTTTGATVVALVSDPEAAWEQNRKCSGRCEAKV